MSVKERKMDINFRVEGTPYAIEKVIGVGAYGAVGMAKDMVGSRHPDLVANFSTLKEKWQ